MKILINRTDAIGDNLLTLPMATALKKHYGEDCHVTMLTSEICIPLFENHPDIDQVVSYNKNDQVLTGLKLLREKLRGQKFDQYYFVGGSPVPSLYAYLKKIPFRGGLKSKWHSFLFLNEGVRQKRSFVSMHESEYNLELLSQTGFDYHRANIKEYTPKVFLSKEKAKADYDDFLLSISKEGLDPSKKMVFIHPGMTGHTLNWASRNYGRLVEQLEKAYPGAYNYIISHTPSDDRFLLGLKQFLQNSNCKNIYFFNGAENGLTNYMHVLSYADVFVGPSTGTTHIANALSIPQIAFYSPILVQSERRWGPYQKGQQVTVLAPDVVCGEQFHCALEKCPYYECMGKIEVGDVVESFDNLIKGEA